MDSLGNIILYFVVAIIIVVFSFMTVKSTKILRAATYLLFVLIGTSIFYFQLGYEFLGAVQLAVYAGGIMVLFVFAILLTHNPNEKSKPLSSHRRVAGLMASVLGAAALIYALVTMPVLNGISLSTALSTGTTVDMHTIGRAFTGSGRLQYLLPFEAVSVLLLACIIGGVVVARKR